MKKLIILALLFVCCASGNKAAKSHYPKNTFFVDAVKDGNTILKMYDWNLIRIDTIIENQHKYYVFYYKERIIK